MAVSRRASAAIYGREVVRLPEIKCTVKECFFWKDDWCKAQQIEVAPRQGTRSAYSDAGTIGGDQPAVTHSLDTQCVTFRPRGAQQPRPAGERQPASSGRQDGQARGRS